MQQPVASIVWTDGTSQDMMCVNCQPVMKGSRVQSMDSEDRGGQGGMTEIMSDESSAAWEGQA